MVVTDFLNRIKPSSNAAFVVSRGASVTPSIIVTGAEVARRIDSFKSGTSTVLVATSVIEEGFDVPRANVVILYDHLKDSVELCQRFGGARAIECSIVVIVERHDRPVEFLQGVQQEQDKIVRSYDPTKNTLRQPEVDIVRQRDRERAVYQQILSGDPRNFMERPLAAFNEFVKKTKASGDATYNEIAGGGHSCELQYSTIARALVSRSENCS